MRAIRSDPALYDLEQRVLYHAKAMERKLPEMRFFILDGWEFVSLLEKYVYPTSPINIWEGKRVVTKKHWVETGQESTLFYEVAQTGNPSYAYLNATNSPMMQASVMAHVCGHCEFSELNVLQDSNSDRTEFVMYLVKKPIWPDGRWEINCFWSTGTPVNPSFPCWLLILNSTWRAPFPLIP